MNNNIKTIKLFEAFAGIGSQHQALKNLGYNVNVVGISEWFVDALVVYGKYHLGIKNIHKSKDKQKLISFLSNYSLSLNSKDPLKQYSGLTIEKLSILQQIIERFDELDITKITGKQIISKGVIDLFTYSFPCQNISSQGKQVGFNKGVSSRSGLLWEIERILKEIKNIDIHKLPKMLLMENVKALTQNKFKKDISIWIKELEKLGYKSTPLFIVNAGDLGEIQERERVFLFSTLNKGENKIPPFQYNKNINPKNLGEVFIGKHEKVKLKKNIKIVKKSSKRFVNKYYLDKYSSFNAECSAFTLDGKCPTLTASGAHSRIKIILDKSKRKVVYLNAKEHLLLMGFNKDMYDTANKLKISSNKIKFLAGNSIHVKVLEEIFNQYL